MTRLSKLIPAAGLAALGVLSIAAGPAGAATATKAPAAAPAAKSADTTPKVQRTKHHVAMKRTTTKVANKAKS